MAKKKKNLIEVNIDKYTCPHCNWQYGRNIPCPKCGKSMQHTILPIQFNEMMAFLKEKNLNYIKLYYFKDVLCYDLIEAAGKPAKKPGKTPAKKPAKKP